MLASSDAPRSRHILDAVEEWALGCSQSMVIDSAGNPWLCTDDYCEPTYVPEEELVTARRMYEVKRVEH